MPKSILVTGGAGYVGSRAAINLAKKGFKITVVDRNKRSDALVKLPTEISYIQGDLRDPSVASRSVQGIDLVIHLAANIGSMTYMKRNQADILQDNSAIDAALYPAIAQSTCNKILYSSSSMVFQHAAKYPYVETDLPQARTPTNVYGLSKLIGEYFCHAYHNQYNLDFVIVRYHNIYGPGENSKGETPGDIHVLPALVKKVLSGQYPLQFLGGLKATRPFTYIDDAVDITVKLANQFLEDDPKVVNQDFNIGPKQATGIIELGQIIWEELGDGRPFKYIVKQVDSQTAVRRQMDPAKIFQATGWKPKMPLRQGIHVVADWIKSRS